MGLRLEKVRGAIALSATCAGLAGCIPDVVPTGASSSAAAASGAGAGGSTSSASSGGGACAETDAGGQEGDPACSDPAWATWEPQALQHQYCAKESTVFDTTTKLTWQRDAGQDLFTFSEATTFCADFSPDGHAWRLPTRIELVSIVDYKTHDPALDVKAFPEQPTTVKYWTKSPYSKAVGSCMNCAFSINFKNGSVSPTDVTGSLHVRCVR